MKRLALLAAIGCGVPTIPCEHSNDLECPTGYWCKHEVCIDTSKTPSPAVTFDGVGLSQGVTEPSVDLPVSGITNVFMQFSNSGATPIPGAELLVNHGSPDVVPSECMFWGPYYLGHSQFIGYPMQITPAAGADLPAGGKLIMEVSVQPNNCPLEGWTMTVSAYARPATFPFHFTTH